MKTRIQKWGDSLVLRIPKSFAAEIGLSRNSSVELALSDGKMVITPVSELKPTLEQLLAKINDDNLHGEVDNGSALGYEIW